VVYIVKNTTTENKKELDYSGVPQIPDTRYFAKGSARDMEIFKQ